MYVQTAGPSDFQNVSGISFLPANFPIDEDNFSSITENSLVVFEDFSFKLADNKQAKINFLKIVNYILRHKKLTLILVIHNLFSNNLSNDILCAVCVKKFFIFDTFFLKIIMVSINFCPPAHHLLTSGTILNCKMFQQSMFGFPSDRHAYHLKCFMHPMR